MLAKFRRLCKSAGVAHRATASKNRVVLLDRKRVIRTRGGEGICGVRATEPEPLTFSHYRPFLSDEPLLLYGNHLKFAGFYFDAFALALLT
jgi:hypothetical protein